MAREVTERELDEIEKALLMDPADRARTLRSQIEAMEEGIEDLIQKGDTKGVNQLRGIINRMANNANDLDPLD